MREIKFRAWDTVKNEMVVSGIEASMIEIGEPESTWNHALRTGRIIRAPCEVCGDTAGAHHDDYDKPLSVRWLCFIHHRQYHKNNPDLLTN